MSVNAFHYEEKVSEDDKASNKSKNFKEYFKFYKKGESGDKQEDNNQLEISMSDLPEVIKEQSFNYDQYCRGLYPLETLSDK